MNKIRALRQQAGLSQRELARRIGVSQVDIYRVENNLGLCWPAWRHKLASVFGRDPFDAS